MIDVLFFRKANFLGLDGVPDCPSLHSVLHEALVNGKQEGTEASAATVVSGCFPAGTEVTAQDGLQPIEVMRSCQ
jgi:serine protease inhibitor